MYELLIENNNVFYSPAVEGGIQWSTDRRGSPGKLTFKVVNDSVAGHPPVPPWGKCN